VIPVGDSGKVELIFHSHPRQRGRIRKSARVTVNDNSRDNFNLLLSGELYNSGESDSLRPLALSEGMITFNPNDRGEKKEIKVTNESDQELHLEMIADAPGFFDVDLPKKIKPGKSEEIEVKVPKDFSDNKFVKSFTFQMDDSIKTRVTIPVSMVSAIPMTTPPPSTKAMPMQKKVMPDSSKSGMQGGKSGH